MKLVKLLLFLTIFFISIFSISASFYGDFKIEVDNSGLVTIDSKTNYVPLEKIIQSDNFTSKKGQIWTLKIETPKNISFTDYIFELTLPENVQINYIKTTPNFRIENKGEKIQIIGIGENTPLIILIQYQKKNRTFIEKNDTNIIIIGIVSIILLTFLYFHFKLKGIREKITSLFHNSQENKINKPNHEKFRTTNQKEIVNISHLPERQIEIINILKKNNSLSQKQITQIMKIPKSSVSRNILALENKNLVIKKKTGISSIIIINEKLEFEEEKDSEN